MVGDGRVRDGVPTTETDGEPPEPEPESTAPPGDPVPGESAPRVSP
jgi:hypothetical protein